MSGGIYTCKLLRQDTSKGLVQWIQRKETARLTISRESLIIREISSGCLLADFPRASITAFRLVKKDVISVEDVERSNKLAIRFDPRQLGELVKELHRHEYPKISNQIAEAIETSSSILGKRKHGPMRLPDLNDVLVQENILEMLFNPKFNEFVHQLQCVVDGFRGQLEPYNGSMPQLPKAVSSIAVNTDPILLEPQPVRGIANESITSKTSLIAVQVQDDIAAAWDDDQFFEDV